MRSFRLLLLTYGELLLVLLKCCRTRPCSSPLRTSSTILSPHTPGHNQQAPASCRTCMRICVSLVCVCVCECVYACAVEPTAFVNFSLMRPCKSKAFWITLNNLWLHPQYCCCVSFIFYLILQVLTLLNMLVRAKIYQFLLSQTKPPQLQKILEMEANR